jgi:4-hydroxy-tetrahydrodipicolinate synthase
MRLRGIIPVLATPFRADESVDEASLRRQVEFCLARGAVALCAPAFGSEYYKLSDQERQEVARVVVSQCRRRVPVFVNVGTSAVRSTLEFCNQAESLGADGVMVTAPRAVPLGTHELKGFFEHVCQAVRLPVILQDVDFAGSGLGVEFLVDLAARCPSLQFVKLETALPGGKCKEIIRLSSGRVSVFYGWAGLRFFDGLAHGACGFMPGAALVDVYATILRLYDAGQLENAKALFYHLLPFLVFALEHLELFIWMEKRILMRRGVIESDRLREPTLRLDDAYQKQAEELVNLALSLAKALPGRG